jgi:hypothetical protein
MPIAAGGIGQPGVLAIPNRRFLTGQPFRSASFSSQNEFITGVTRDSTGVALASCTVHLLRTPSDAIAATTVSDGSGNYSFANPGSGPFYLVAYKPGSPDVAGTTVNTVTATFA